MIPDSSQTLHSSDESHAQPGLFICSLNTSELHPSTLVNNLNIQFSIWEVLTGQRPGTNDTALFPFQADIITGPAKNNDAVPALQGRETFEG